MNWCILKLPESHWWHRFQYLDVNFYCRWLLRGEPLRTPLAQCNGECCMLSVACSDKKKSMATSSYPAWRPLAPTERHSWPQNPIRVAEGWYTLPVRTGRKERPYIRPVRTGVIFLRPYVRSILAVRKSEFLTPVRDTRTYGP